MKIAFIHNDKKIGTGAHFINDLIANKLREGGVEVNNFYPKFLPSAMSVQFKGFNNILFFYSLLEKRDKILPHDIIQGTTYTTLAFVRFSTPIVAHFGSTTIGFLRAVPKTNRLPEECGEVFYRLKREKVIDEVDIKTRRPLHDIVCAERFSAKNAARVIATSEIVKNDLIGEGIDADKIVVIHNAIEDYWFDHEEIRASSEPTLVFLGRLGDDSFTLKLKGLGRLIWLFERFPEVKKLSVVMSRNGKLINWLRTRLKNHEIISNEQKFNIPGVLRKHAGGIIVMASRYEGFSLSLIEGMSQGLVPVSFAVGVAPEIIQNGVNGYVVESLEEAEQRIRELLADGDLRRRMMNKAIKTAEGFDSETMVGKMMALYEDILAKK